MRSIESAVGSAFDDIIVSSDAANRIDGRAGSDTVSYDLSARGQLINLAGGAATDGVFTDALLSIENAIGSGFDDIIVSSDAANRIDGRGGSDTVSYDLSARGQLINLAGGAATDGVATDTLLSIENAIGSELSDVMHGNGLDNILDGGAGGSDQIDGADGSDTVSYAFSRRGVLRRRRRSTGSTPTRCPRSRTPSARNSPTASWPGRMLTGSRAATETTPSCSGAAMRTAISSSTSTATGAAGDSLELIGFGTLADGASLTQLDGTHWRINSADGSAHEIITPNGAIIDQSDFVFI